MRVENSFIPVRGVGKATERKLWAAGITTWDEFDGSVVGSTLSDRIEAFVDEARDRLAADDARYFDRQFPNASQWRLYEDFCDRAAFFDIETTGLSRTRHEVTTLSVHRGGRTRTLVRGRDLTREAVREALDAPLLVSFNGARFDVPFLEQSFDLSIDRPHLDLMYPCRRVDLTGGLSAVERELGVDRDHPDVGGEEAVRLWYEYERDDNQHALERLVEYNQDDAANLRPVADAVTDRLHHEIFEPVCPE